MNVVRKRVGRIIKAASLLFLLGSIAAPAGIWNDYLEAGPAYHTEFTSAVPDTVIELSNSKVSEEASDSTVIGTIGIRNNSAALDSPFFLVNDAEGRFGIARDSLLIVRRNDLMDYEKQNEHPITIGAETADGDTVRQDHIIKVTDANEPPKDILLSDREVPEHNFDSLEVGTISVVEEDSADSVELQLTDDAAGRFALQGNRIVIDDTTRFNYEKRRYHLIQVHASDRLGASFEKEFRIRVLDRNDPPERITVQPSSIPEDTEPGSLIGKLLIHDEDSVDQHRFEFGSLQSSQLKLGDSLLYLGERARLDHETEPYITFSVQGQDSAGASITDTLRIRVSNVNEPPEIEADGDLVMDEDQSRRYYLRVWDPESLPAELDMSIHSDNPALISENRIKVEKRGIRRLLRIKPRPDSNGVATLKVALSDGEFVDSTQFRIRVRPVNDSPYLVRNIERRLDEGARLLINRRTLHVRDVDNDPPELTYEIIDAPDHGQIMYRDEKIDDRPFSQEDIAQGLIWYKHDGSEQHRDTVRLAVSDGQEGEISNIILPFSIVPINDPPVISEIEDRYILEDHSTDQLTFTISDSETAGVNLGVAGSSSNEKVVPDSNIIVTGIDQYRAVKVTPSTDAHGQTEITLNVNDGKDTTSTSFDVTVKPVNDAPRITMPDTIRMKEDETAGPVPIRYFDQETPTKELDWEIESTNERLLTREGIQVDGAGADKKLYLSPKSNEYGQTRIITRLNDGELADTSKTFVRVKPVNDPPRAFKLFNSKLKQTFDSVEVTFNWEETGDVEQQEIKYVLNLRGAGLDTTIYDINNSEFTFKTVEALKPNMEYQWRVQATDGRDTTESNSVKQFLTPDLKQKPQEYELYSNYPNPFNPVTRIKYKIPVKSKVKVSVYDMSGRMVSRLVNEVQSPGEYEVSWDAGDRASGIYVCRIMANGVGGDKRFIETRKMMLVK